MDDWNRLRHHTRIGCKVCRAKAKADERAEQQRQRERDKLVSKAERIAERRYMKRWLEIFENRNKHEIWLLLTDGDGYPALRTFYKQVKGEGLSQYLRRNFFEDLPGALTKMGVEDNDIQDLLAASERI
jgi:hypothetical protein